MASDDEFRSELERMIDEFVPEGWSGVGALDPEEREELLGRWRALLVERRLLAPTWPNY